MERKYYQGKLIEVGDILCVRDGHSIVAQGIQFYMKRYKKKNHLDPDIPLYHHSALVIEVWGKLYVAEALSKGWTIQPIDEAYSQKAWAERIEIIRPEISLTSFEKEMLCKLAVQTSFKVTRYDYFNFLFQIWLIETGKWIGPVGKKAENRFYCSEGVATIYNYIRPGTFKNPAATNPLDIALNTNFAFI